jgi:hypothetical protein
MPGDAILGDGRDLLVSDYVHDGERAVSLVANEEIPA